MVHTHLFLRFEGMWFIKSALAGETIETHFAFALTAVSDSLWMTLPVFVFVVAEKNKSSSSPASWPSSTWLWLVYFDRADVNVDDTTDAASGSRSFSRSCSCTGSGSGSHTTLLSVIRELDVSPSLSVTCVSSFWCPSTGVDGINGLASGLDELRRRRIGRTTSYLNVGGNVIGASWNPTNARPASMILRSWSNARA